MEQHKAARRYKYRPKGTMATPPGVTFLCDSNEMASTHLGYDLEPRRVKKLHVGDYSVETPEGLSLEEVIVIERKSLVNLLGDTCGENRDRWQRCLARLAQVRYPALVVEASWHDLLQGGYSHTRLDPRAATGSLLAWSMRFGVPVWLVGTRAEGMELTRRLLVKAAIEHAEGAQIGRDPRRELVTHDDPTGGLPPAVGG